ncbi:MAG: enoyl-CoA hydratase/isomerase family protein [Rhodobacterales bacterium]|nr:enoyl-CoA hydratase/isomerase family protein [Rhodobacterales bacterium]
MDEPHLIVARDGPIATLTLNRPRVMNAWTGAMRGDLTRALADCGADDAVRAVVVTGAGEKAFCAGQDLNESQSFDADAAEAWIEDFRALYAAVRSLEKPVVAAINGVAAGSGFQFALLTDVRVGHPGVRMGQPEINSGIASVTGPWIMREIVGLSHTVELTLTGRLVNAEEAQRLGLLHEVVPQDWLMERARERAGELAAKPPLAMSLIKRRFWETLKPGFDEAMAAAIRLHRQSYAAGEPQAESARFLADRAARRGN